MKRTSKHVRLDPEVEDKVKKIADLTGLSQLEVIRQAIRAGVEAIKDNNYELPLPLKLKVVPKEAFPQPTRMELNETREPRPKQK